MTRREIITHYAMDCRDDKFPACKKHKWMCQRLLRDFDRLDNDPDYPYYWDEAEAEKIVKWFTYLRHQKGELAGQPINLTPWQQSHICQLYGWRRKDNGRRRFTKMMIQVARKNAKTQEEAGVCLYEMSVTAKKNGEMMELFTAGGKKEESKKCFEEAGNLLNGSPLRPKFQINRSEIRYPDTGSYLKMLSKDDGKNGDGSNPAVLVLDEYHQHKNTDFYDLAMGSNSKSPLLIIITTAGVDPQNSPAYREYQYVSNVLNPDSDIEDEIYLIDICEQDEGEVDDPRLLTDEKLWLKSNPIRASFEEGRERIRQSYEKALQVPEEMPKVLTKNFNIWVQARAGGYMDMKKWKACEVQELPIDIRGLSCAVGIDVSATIDLTSCVFVIPYEDPVKKNAAGEPVVKYIVFHHSFIPNRDKLIERINVDKAPYDAWEMQGYLSVTNTDVVDQMEVVLWAMNFAKEHDLHIAYWAPDPSNAGLLMTTLSDAGENVCQVKQSYQSLNDPTLGLRNEIFSKNVMYLPDPLLNFAMGNAVVRKSNGLIKIDKDSTKQRIDPIDALICAFKLARYIKQDAYSQERANAALDAWMKTLDAL